MPAVTAVLVMAGDGGWKQARWRGREDATRAPCHLQNGRRSTGWLEGKGSWEKPGVKGARERGKHDRWPETRASEEKEYVPTSSLE